MKGELCVIVGVKLGEGRVVKVEGVIALTRQGLL